MPLDAHERCRRLAAPGCGGARPGDEGGIPSELVGSYTTTLEQSDIPANPLPQSSRPVSGSW